LYWYYKSIFEKQVKEKMNIDNHFENLIARYLNGECSGQEAEELYAWISKDADHMKLFTEIKDTWDSIPGQDISIDKYLAQFYKNQSERRKVIQLRYWKQALAAAAVLAIGLLSGILLMQDKTKPVESQIVFTVPLGSKSAVTLADGSVVMLNSGSTLTYSSANPAKTREVHLEGEGFFTVQPDPQKPFIVTTTDFSIEVKGTAFNICSYSDNPFSSATLTEGMIALTFTNSGSQLELVPGERLRIDRETNRYSRAMVDVEPEIAWKNSEFIFRNIAFSELVRRLERWYDVKLHYTSGELKEFTYSGRFKNQETIWQVLDALKLTTPIDYRRGSFREFEISYKPTKK
jgi:transmembrane sensor